MQRRNIMILIKNAYIKPMVGDDIECGSILLGDDGKISAIGTDIEAPAGAEIIDAEGKPEDGCVVVTAELAELLQMLMDKFTFEGVEYSWCKLCYYYDYMGQ